MHHVIHITHSLVVIITITITITITIIIRITISISKDHMRGGVLQV